MTNPITFWRNEWDGYSAVEKAVAVVVLAAAIGAVFVTIAWAAPAETAAPNNQAAWIALIAAVPLALSGPIIAWMNEQSRRRDRREDLAERTAVAERQSRTADMAEAVARNAAQAVRDVASQAVEAARLLDEKDKKDSKATADTKERLDVIHTLVNSGFTASKQAELDAKREGLALLLEIVELKKANGKEPGEQTTKAIGAAQAKIVELDAAITERQAQANEIDKLKAAKAIAQLKKDA